MEAEMKLKEANLSTSIMVDCSHGNSQKQHLNQIQVAKEVANQLVEGTSPIKGVMIESFLVEGKQNWSNQLVYGQSITDACLSWEQTVPVLENLAQAIRERRKRMTS
ncbi:3-deoxy-7-phosphoheptulonate synthase [Coelomomyces lativittatus]|nr:3-deoxy-7-phosphoheptulonate synthase [Coelomomyces lativittatus]